MKMKSTAKCRRRINNQQPDTAIVTFYSDKETSYAGVENEIVIEDYKSSSRDEDDDKKDNETEEQESDYEEDEVPAAKRKRVQYQNMQEDVMTNTITSAGKITKMRTQHANDSLFQNDGCNIVNERVRKRLGARNKQDEQKKTNKNKRIDIESEAYRVRRTAPSKGSALSFANSAKKHKQAMHSFQYLKRLNIETQCRSNGLKSLIDEFTPKQKQAVEEIGFGGLLTIKLTETATGLLPWLVDNFDPSSRRLQVSSTTGFTVTEEDVYDVFLLPINKLNKVEENAKSDATLKQRWKDTYGVKDDNGIIWVRLNRLAEILKEMTEGGDEFKRLFVMYVVSSFLDPVSNRCANLKIVNAIENVTMIRELNWCYYVLQKVCEAIKKYKSHTGKKVTKVVGGCLVLLEILYFHRLKFQGKSQPTELPLIQHWTNEKVRERINGELSARSVGNGDLELGIYPVCRYRTGSMHGWTAEAIAARVNNEEEARQLRLGGNEQCLKLKKVGEVCEREDRKEEEDQPLLIEHGSGEEVRNQEAQSSQACSSRQEYIQKISYITRKLAADLVEFGELMAEVEKQYPGSETLKQLHNNAREMFSNFSKSWPEIQPMDEPIDGNSLPNMGPSQDNGFFNEPEVPQAIIELETAHQRTCI